MFKPYIRSYSDKEWDSKYVDILQHCTIAKVKDKGTEKNITQHWNKITKSYLNWVDFKGNK